MQNIIEYIKLFKKYLRNVIKTYYKKLILKICGIKNIAINLKYSQDYKY